MLRLISFLFLTVISFSVFAQDPKATHGMLVFGTEKIYLSHLPMYHVPHQYQFIMEVEFPPQAKAKYLENQKAHPNEYTTIVPERFVLPLLAEKPFPFSGELYVGHFERGGIAFTTVKGIKVRNIVYFQKLDFNEEKLLKPTYLLFGSPTETFIAHIISGGPNFDHIAQVTGANKNLFPSTVVEFTKHDTDIAMTSTDLEVRAANKTENLESLRTIYLEYEDLKR